MRLPAHDATESLEVKMTPMIDVVFLLLIFFVWTSSFEVPEYDLPSSLAELPAAGSQQNPTEQPPVEAFDEVVVKLVMRSGLPTVQFGGETLDSTEQLADRLSKVIELGVQPPVIIDPDDEIQMAFAVKAYDAARSAGADRVLYATDAK